MVLNKRLDCLRRQLETDFVVRDHIDMYHISLDVDELIVEQGFDQWIRVLSEFRFGSLG